MLLTPLAPGGSTESSGKIWTAASDSTLVVWADVAGTGNMDASKATVVLVDGGQSECASARGNACWSE